MTSNATIISEAHDAAASTLRVLRIVEGTSVDGPGLRTSIYLAGCNHACPGCHNPQSWDFNGGKPMAISDVMDVIRYNEAPVTLSGGDPLLQIESATALLREVKRQLGYNVWVYTGFTWEQVLAQPKLRQALPYVDVLVDGPFVQAQRNLSLRFKGSANQRLIAVPQSLASGHVTLWQG